MRPIRLYFSPEPGYSSSQGCSRRGFPLDALRRSIRWRRCVMNKTNIEDPTSNAEHRTRGGAQECMTKDEFPMSKEFLSPNVEGNSCELAGKISSLVVPHSFD